MNIIQFEAKKQTIVGIAAKLFFYILLIWI